MLSGVAGEGGSREKKDSLKIGIIAAKATAGLCMVLIVGER